MRRKILLIVIVLFVGIQLIPVARTNPATTAELAADESVKGILTKACYDCHSNETRWPWYSYVAPASWLVASDVNEGREHLNFSEWRNYRAEDQTEKRNEIREEVEKGAMPMRIYLLMHRDAKLRDSDVAQLEQWAKTH